MAYTEIHDTCPFCSQGPGVFDDDIAHARAMRAEVKAEHAALMASDPYPLVSRAVFALRERR